MTALRVLLVDDEKLALKRLATLFGDIDEVELVGTASTGREAEERIASLAPDLVMLDISMPQKSGLRVAADMPADQRPEITGAVAPEEAALLDQRDAEAAAAGVDAELDLAAQRRPVGTIVEAAHPVGERSERVVVELAGEADQHAEQLILVEEGQRRMLEALLGDRDH